MLTVNNVSMQFSTRKLYEDVNLKFTPGNCYGVIGANGAGKSTFLKILEGKLQPTTGTVSMGPNERMSSLNQNHFAFEDEEGLATVIRGHEKLYEIMTEKDALYAKPDFSDEDGIRAAELEGEFAEMDGWNAESEADQLLQNLGIDESMQHLKMSELTEPQKVKVLLGQALFGSPDVLLLDEPTNYLDVSHIAWLTDWLQNFEGAFIVISHDFDFLENVTNAVLDIEFGQITKYTGTLKQAMRQKEADHETYLKAFAKQQETIKKTEAFIRKFKAGTRATMAKSREKQLARMDKLTPPGTRAKAHLAFPYMPVNRQMLVDVNDLVVGYDKPLLQPINFSVAKDQVIAFEGFNGVGKSTLLKTILGLLPALGGSVEIADNVTFGYYEQELHWDQPKQSPVQYLQQRFPALTQKTVRQVLSRTALTSEEANNPLTMLSGGEQAKVKLADLMLQTTNILVMDEPTNHLDDDTKKALRTGLQQYPGAVLLVSHEAGFYDHSWVDTVVNVEQFQVKE